MKNVRMWMICFLNTKTLSEAFRVVILSFSLYSKSLVTWFGDSIYAGIGWFFADWLSIGFDVDAYWITLSLD